MRGRKIVAAYVALAMIMSAFVIISIRPAQAWPPTTTPGHNDYGNGTTDFVYSTTAQTVQINTTGLTANTDYYLFKPTYNNTLYNVANEFDWVDNYVRDDDGFIATFKTHATDPTNRVGSFGDIVLDRAGMWILDSDTTHAGDDAGSFDAFIWVNTSSAYDIDTISDFKYGVNTSHTIYVRDASDNLVTCWVDLIGPDGDTIKHWPHTTGVTFDDWLNCSYAGNYTVRAYTDLDLHKSDDYGWTDETTTDGVKAGFDSTYGQNFSSAIITSLEANGDHWNYSICGPWDPPEINATEMVFAVEPGVPELSITTANKTMYYNFSGQVNVTIKDSSGGNMPAADYTVEVYNRAGTRIHDSISHLATADINITKANGYFWLDATTGWGYNRSAGSGYGTNGTWTVRIWVDKNDDRTENLKTWTEEWNGSTTFKVTKAPGTQFKWIDDDDGESTNDNDGEIPWVPIIGSAPLILEFQIIGSDHTYFGAATTGIGSLNEAKENITISGDALYTGTLDKMPSVNFNGSRTWSVPIIPQNAIGGGQITITGYWKGYGTVIETVSVGGTNYATNGSVVTVTPTEFEIGTDQNFQITVTDANGNPNPWASIYLYYTGDGYQGTDGTPITTHEIDRRLGGGTSAGEFTIGFNTTQQRKNQTSAYSITAANARAPRNLTIYVTGLYVGYGYARVMMKPRSNLKVEASHETMLAGYSYDGWMLNTTIVNETGESAGTPESDDESKLTIRIFDIDGDDVTAGMGTRFSNFANQLDGDYTISLNDLYFTKFGTFTVYAWNYTSDSTGNNATIVVNQVNVACDKSPLIWQSDDNISATFTCTDHNGDPVNGELLIDNMSLSDDAKYNKTWTNTSYDGTTDQGGNQSIILGEPEGLVNGVVTLYDITAHILPDNVAMENITFWFRPENTEGNLGDWARAFGRVPVRVPNILTSSDYLALGEDDVTLTTIGRGDEAIGGIFVGLNGRGISVATTNGTTGTDGTIEFSVITTTTGKVDIHVGEEGRIISKKLTVTNRRLDVTVDPLQVNEGADFTVTAMEEGTTTAVEGATISIQGIGTGTTDSDGKATFTAPAVTVGDYDMYTIKVTAAGYREELDTITVKVKNVPTLTMALPDKAVEGGKTFEVTVANQDTGFPIIGATVTFNGETYTTKSGGVATITAPTVEEETTFDITASFGTFVDATGTVTVAKGTPGFELLTLIIALGVAFILLKRRRRR